MVDSPHDADATRKAGSTLRADEATALEEATRDYAAAPMARLRRRVLGGFFIGCGVLALLYAAVGAPFLAVGAVGFAALTGLGYLVTHAVVEPGDVARKHVAWLRNTCLRTRLSAAVALLVALALLFVVGLAGAVLALAVAAAVLAAAAYFTLDRRVAAERRPALERTEAVVKELRRRGVDDETIQFLVCRHGGWSWEPCFEALFGYDAKRAARDQWGRDELGRPRPTHAAWRDPVADWLDRRLADRDTDSAVQPPPPVVARPRPVQRLNQVIRGWTTADDKAKAAEPSGEEAAAPSSPGDRSVRRGRVLSELVSHTWAWGRPLAAALLAPSLRFVAGLSLLVLSGLWVHQNGLVTTGERVTDTTVAVRLADNGSVRAATETDALRLPRAPNALTAWVNSYDPAVAGLILIASCAVGSSLSAVFGLAAAALVLAGPSWPGWLPLPYPNLVAAAGLLVASGLAGALFPDRGPSVRGERVAARRLGLVTARGDVLHPPAGRGGEGPPAVRALREALATALQAGASDIHLQPEGGRVRMRIHGTLVDAMEVDPELLPKVLNLVRILCELDTARRPAAQEAHFSMDTPRRRVDCRASFIPAMEGQKLVIRLLDAAGTPKHVDELGMPAWMAGELRTALAKKTGMVLACGPTGSGKSTTLHAGLRDVDRRRRHVMTIEDPVESHLEGATQIQVDESGGRTFDRLLRSTLRQDPDVILLGEIRDADTARNAMRAAMTGHLVLSTLHAQDAPTAVVRLLDLGVEPGLLGSSVTLVLSQRLVRTLCPGCKRARKPTGAEAAKLREMGGDAARVGEPVGCKRCWKTGFAGRRGLFEVLRVSDRVREGLRQSTSTREIRAALSADDYVSLERMGWQLVAEGSTSPSEVFSVVEPETEPV